MFPTRALFVSLVSQPFKRAQLGLFHGKTKQYGNNNPHSKKKTRRTWLPNVQSKRLVSALLGRTLRLTVTTRALRTIKKYNGLDNYVLNTKPELLGWEGMRLRTLMREALAAQQQRTDAAATELIDGTTDNDGIPDSVVTPDTTTSITATTTTAPVL